MSRFLRIWPLMLRYAAATIPGIPPARFVYASIGAGLSALIATGRVPDGSLMFSPGVCGPLLGPAPCRGDAGDGRLSALRPP